ncbi:hypothetical protein [Sorangium sp. So ce385]|uniref:hypothetical protein n=1 Tax=Sorangium sp. So ce385 TaxID=3133308 RepID=UPI003F5B8BD2
MSPLENVSVHRATRGPERHARSRSSLGPLLLAALGAALTVSAAPKSAEASVFDSATRWPEDADGYVRIPVCIDATSSAQQRADGAAGGLIHAPNPSLAEVVTRVRTALQGSWERWSSVRFTGWESCDSLLPATRMSYVGVRIHPDAPNQSDSIGVYNKGGLVQFNPWGAEFNRCIKYNWQTARVEYSFDCVEQYAIHEMGHAIGFMHEWHHPLVPSGCSQRQPLPASDVASGWPSSRRYIVVNPGFYDYDSIMTYWGGCSDQDGVRFGSESLDAVDIQAVATVYPPVAGAPDVCNPGWFGGKRWFCAAQPTVSVGNSCSSGWVECLPHCNPRPFQGEWWTCPTNPSTVTGQSCSAPWELCGY